MKDDLIGSLKALFKRDGISDDKKEKILIIFLLGVFLLLIAAPVSDYGTKYSKKKVKQEREETIVSKPDTKKISNDEYISYLENKLEQTIGGMDGAGRVRVMITLKDGGEKILDKNRPYESASDTSKEEGKEAVSEKIKSMQETVLVQKDGDTGPIVIKEQYPDVLGVVVLCDGGNNEELIIKIKEMAGALFGLDAHKIVVGKLSQIKK